MKQIRMILIAVLFAGVCLSIGLIVSRNQNKSSAMSYLPEAIYANQERLLIVSLIEQYFKERKVLPKQISDLTAAFGTGHTIPGDGKRNREVLISNYKIEYVSESKDEAFFYVIDDNGQKHWCAVSAVKCPRALLWGGG